MSPFNMLRSHLPEYLLEGLGLGLFMIAASTFGTLLGHPSSPLHAAIGSAAVRRVLMGLAMGSTAVALIYSPIGARSGAHMNPATTMTFWRLRKIKGLDAAGYIVGQIFGGLAGIALAAAALGARLAHPSVNYVATIPGIWGLSAAFAGELAISFVLMSTILTVSNHPRLSRYTGLFAGALVALYIALEEPVSGMSMNPARSLSSALPSHTLAFMWIYALAPLAGMLLAAETFVRARGLGAVLCAKLHHHTNARCIFECRFDELQRRGAQT